MGKNKNTVRTKKRGDKHTASNETTDDKQPAPRPTPKVVASSSSAIDTSSPHSRSYDGSSTSPTRSSSASHGAANPSGPTDKRDSVIPSSWEGSQHDLRPKSKLNQVLRRWWRIRPSGWLPCRVVRWIYDLVTAIGRAYWGPHQRDLFLTFCLATVCVSVGYVALEVLLGMFRVVAAQDIDANCSIVYVTVPGPIITVSLIGATPSNPARGTYYFSVVNGTTEWLNSIAPPSRFSTLPTKTPEITPIISSLSPPGISSLPPNGGSNTPGSSSPVRPSFGPTNTLTTIILSDSTLISTIITSVPFGGSSTPAPLPPPSVVLSPPGLSEPTTSSSAPPVYQPQISGRSSILSTNLVATSLVLPSTASYSTVLPINPSSTAFLPSSSVLSGSLVVSPGAPSISSQTTISSILITVTSIMPGASTTMVTSFSTTVLVGGPLVSPSYPASPIITTILITPTKTISGESTTTLIGTLTVGLSGAPSGTTSLSSKQPTSSVVTTLTSTVPNEPITTILNSSTVIVSPSPTPPTTPSDSALRTTSSILITITSTASNEQLTTTTRVSFATFSLSSTTLLPSLSASPSSLSAGSLTSTRTGDLTSVVPDPSTGLRSSSATTVSTVATTRLTIVTSGLTTTMALISSTPAPNYGTPTIQTLSFATNPASPTTLGSVLPLPSSLFTGSSSPSSGVVSPSPTSSPITLSIRPSSSLATSGISSSPPRSSSSISSSTLFGPSITRPTTPLLSSPSLTASGTPSSLVTSVPGGSSSTSAVLPASSGFVYPSSASSATLLPFLSSSTVLTSSLGMSSPMTSLSLMPGTFPPLTSSPPLDSASTSISTALSTLLLTPGLPSSGTLTLNSPGFLSTASSSLNVSSVSSSSLTLSSLSLLSSTVTVSNTSTAIRSSTTLASSLPASQSSSTLISPSSVSGFMTIQTETTAVRLSSSVLSSGSTATGLIPASSSSPVPGSLLSSVLTPSVSSRLNPTTSRVTSPTTLTTVSTLTLPSASASSLSSSSPISTSTQTSTPLATTPLFIPTPPPVMSSNSSSSSPDSVLSSTVTTLLPLGSNGTSSLLARGLTTKVISYGETAVSFIFPLPDITTTVSYWTGVYPNVTGPLPSEFQTLPLTTRTNRQTALSALPSFALASARPSRFKTVVTMIFEDDNEPAPTLARRAEVAVTTTVQEGKAITTVVAEPEPTWCGESGNFTLTFDDTVVGNDDNLLLVANGMTNPYHHLFYANGFTYVPDKWEPYPAVSQPNVALFLPLAGRLLPNTPFAGTLLPGELGAGPRASVNAYWFNAYSAYFGCALNGLTPCTLRISGYRFDAALKQEVLVVEQNATIPACWGYINCRLVQVFFNDQFRALSGIQFNAYTYNLGIPQVHMMDDLQMEWYNNTCSAGILRIGHR